MSEQPNRFVMAAQRMVCLNSALRELNTSLKKQLKEAWHENRELEEENWKLRRRLERINTESR